MNKIVSLIKIRKLLDYRFLSSKLSSDGTEMPKAIKKEAIQNRITLITNDNSVSITDLKSAQNLSNKRELKLVKIQDVDAKTRRPVYKLMTNAEYYEEEFLRRKEKKHAKETDVAKGKKLITLSPKIAKHDLMTGIKKMLKLLEKRYEVKVVIAGEGAEGMQIYENIFSTIENNIKPTGKIVQKVSKGNSLRFQLMPVRESSEDIQKSKPEKMAEPGDSGPL